MKRKREKKNGIEDVFVACNVQYLFPHTFLYVTVSVFFSISTRKLKKKNLKQKKGRISSKTNNRHFKNFVSVGTILIFDFCKKLTFFFLLFSTSDFSLYILSVTASLFFSLSLSGVLTVFLFCFVSGWRTCLIFVRRRGLRHPTVFPPSVCPYVCVFACWVRVTKYFRRIMFGGKGVGEKCFLIFGSSIDTDGERWKKNNRQCLFSFQFFSRLSLWLYLFNSSP